MAALTKLILIGCILCQSAYTYAASKAIEFSADAVISIPQKTAQQSKLFVSKKAVRRDMVVNGQNFTEIVYPDEGRLILINDLMKSYKERSLAKQADLKNYDKPCSRIMNTTCENMGTETIDGFKTEKWQIISNNNGRKLRTLHWIDVKRKLALREFFPDGTVAELKKIKTENINGRSTEKWQRILSRPDGSSSSSFQWYDTALGIAIREELPGGYIRELKNIKVKNQPSNIFDVPDGYIKLDRRIDARQVEIINR